MGTLGVEAIIGLVLAGLTLVITIIGHYFYVRGKLHKAAAGAIDNAEQDDKTGKEKLELAVDQVYGLVPTSLKVFIHRSSVRKIVQAAFDKIEEYAKKQVEKRSKKKEDRDCSADEECDSPNENPDEIIVSAREDEYADSGGADSAWNELNSIINQNDPAPDCAATKDNDQTPDTKSATQLNTSRACSINKNSIQEKIIMENNNVNNVIDNEPVTCYEDVSARTEYSKQFTNPKTGLHTAVLFSSPIDNNDGISTAADGDDFIDALNDEGEEVYENRRNKFLVRLAKSTAQNKLVELVQGDYKISMSPVAAVTSKLNRFVGTIRRDIQAMRNLRRDPKAAKNKITELIHGAVKLALKDREPSDVRFANIINNCDLEYLVENNRLKENIIVNARSEAYEYLFNLNLGKLEARMSGKQIELYDAATNEVKFLIPAPFMYDMANEKSDAVEYLLEGGAGNYTLRVIADEAWINSDARQFPVVIDPQIMGNTTSFITMQCRSNNGAFSSPASDTVALGYVKYNNLEWDLKATLNAAYVRSQINTNSRITHAILELTKTSNTQPHTEGFTVKYGSKVLDKFEYNGYNNRIEIDITDEIQKIIDNGSNIELIIERASKSDKSADDFLVVATEKIANSEYKPRIFIDFVSARLDTNEMAYETISMGKFGTGSVNLATQKSKWVCPDIDIKRKGVSLSISHIYDDFLAGKENDAVDLNDQYSSKTHSYACGKGWKLNLHQNLLTAYHSGLMGSSSYVYIDGSGNHHEFMEKYYYDDPTYGYPHYVSLGDCNEDGLGNLSINVNNKSCKVKHKIENEQGLQLETYHKLLEMAIRGETSTKHYYYMDHNGKLDEQHGGPLNNPGLIVIIEYKDGTKIRVNNKIDVQEIEQYQEMIKSYDNAITNLNIQLASTADLISHYNDLMRNLDEYASNYYDTYWEYATQKEALQHNKLAFTMQKENYEKEKKQVQTKLSQAISDKKREPIDFITDNNGRVLGFDYDGRLVMINDGGNNVALMIYGDDGTLTAVVDKDGNILAKFDYNENGLLNSIVDINGVTVKYDYGTTPEQHKLESIIRDNGESAKYFYNTSNELVRVETLTNWACMNRIGGKVTHLIEETVTDKVNKDGVKNCAENVISERVIGKISTLTTEVADAKSGITTTYIFDLLGRPVTVYRKDGGKTNASTMDYYARNRAFSGNCDMTKISNLLANGNFTTNSGWVTTGTVTYTTDTAFANARVIQVSSNATVIQSITTAGKIESKKMYLFSAWAKADSWYIVNNRRHTAYGDDIFGYYENDAADSYKQNRKFGIIAKIYKGTTVSATYTASFDNYNTDWQMCMLPIYIDDASAITKIEVELAYANNQGSAKFADCALFECEDFIAKTFDAASVLTSARTQDGLTEYFYDDKRLEKATFANRSGKELTANFKYDIYGRPCFVSDFDGNCQERFYDEQGNVVRTEEYNIADTTSKYVYEYVYDADGNVIKESDPRGDINGEQLASEYVYRRGLNTETKNAAHIITAVGYDRLADADTAFSCDAFGDGNTNNLKYTQGFLTTVSHNGFDIDYEYDGKGRVLKTSIAGIPIASNDFTDTADECNYAVATFYGNNQTLSVSLKTTTDKKGNIQSIIDTANNFVLLDYVYENDRLSELTDGITNTIYQYTYSDVNLIKTTFVLHETSVEYNTDYDDKDCVTSYSVSIGGTLRTCINTYEDESNSTRHILKTQILPNGTMIKPRLDSLGRLSGIEHISNRKTVMSENRYYVKRGDRTCDLVSSERFGINGEMTEHTKYMYDKSGNISEVYENGRLAARYIYDGVNRLIRENNVAFNTTTTYTYDVGGNITVKNIYDFTLGDVKDKTPKSIKKYAYKATGWRDQMTAYGGEKCVYDAIGRPTTYRNTFLTWNKYGPLTNYGSTIAYQYNANGIRISKTVNGKSTKFFIDGAKIIRSVIDNGEEIWYNYGVNGIQGITVKKAGAIYETEYLFRKNVLGDITHIYELNSGTLTLAAKYVYDAWGNHKVLSADGAEDTNPQSIGNINPIRYRGYYYDTETKLYYLNARYYDPEVGRFISADSTHFLEPNTVNGLNLYAYCGNNPVMNVDPSGRFPILSLILGIVAIVGMGLAIGGVATDNHVMTAIGLTMVAIPALISGGLAVAAGIGGATLTGITGGVTVFAGIGSGLFASAEYQQNFTGNNWMIDAGMSEGWYKGLMLTTAAIATLGTIASSFCYNFDIKSISKIGKLRPANHPNQGYHGIMFKDARGSLKSIELQRHAPHGLHFQLNSWNPRHMSVSTIKRWTWFLTRL